MSDENEGTQAQPVNDGSQAQEQGNGAHEGTGGPEPGSTEETFDRTYVEGLRREAAEYRTRAKRADALHERLLEAAIREGSRDVLEDSEDVKHYREGDDFLDDEGFPAVEKVRTAAEELAKEKPHLARRKGPSGDVGQGPRPEPPSEVDFARMLREAAG